MKIIPQLLEGLIRDNIGKEQWAQCPAWSKHSGNGKCCVLSLDGRPPNTHKHKVLTETAEGVPIIPQEAESISHACFFEVCLFVFLVYLLET